MNKKTVLIKRILIVIFAVLLTVSSLLTVVMSSLNYVIFNRDFYIARVTDDQFVTEVKAHLESALKTDCLILGFPYDEIDGVITPNLIKQCTTKYVDTLMSYDEGDKIDIISPDVFMHNINAYAMNSEDPGIFAEEENRVQLAERFASRINEIFGNVVSQPAVRNTIRLLFNNDYLQILSDYMMPVFVFTALFFLTVLLLKISSYKKQFFRASSCLFFGTGIAFAPVLAVRIYELFFGEIAQRVALSYSFVRTFVVTVVRSVMNSITLITALPFCLSFVLLVISSVLYSKERAKLKEARKKED